MRLINADDLIYMEYGGIEFVPTEFIKEAPTIDAVPVVRCKDCKHKENEEPRIVYCPNQKGGWVSEDFFCADGDREIDEIDKEPITEEIRKKLKAAFPALYELGVFQNMKTIETEALDILNRIIDKREERQ